MSKYDKLNFAIFLSIAAVGCGIRGYHWATYGAGDTSAGDVTHASQPGARVVIPNNLLDPAAPQVAKARCGVERWAIKTLADPEAGKVFARWQRFNKPRRADVRVLAGRPAGTVLGAQPERCGPKVPQRH